MSRDEFPPYDRCSCKAPWRYAKLSDSFKRKEGEPELELKVWLLNINQGSNLELMKKCQTLREYSELDPVSGSV